MINPFDWRSVLLDKHAQHVVLIHFSIADLTVRSAGNCRLVDSPALRTVLPPSVSLKTHFNNVAFCWSSVMELTPGFKSTFKSHMQG